MSKTAPNLDDASDLPGLAREALGIHLKKYWPGPAWSGFPNETV